MTDNRYSFDNLTQSGLLRVNSKDDKDVSLSVNAFGGMTSFSVFTKSGGRPYSQTIGRDSIARIVVLLRQMRNDPKPCRQPIMIKQYDPEAKRSKEVGQLAFGIDENLLFQIEMSGEELRGRHIFPIKPAFKMDFSNTTLSEKENLQATIDYVIELLTVVAPIAERITSFKRPAQSGGNKGGYSNNSSGGNKNYGGGSPNNAQRQGQGTFGGNNDVGDNDISY